MECGETVAGVLRQMEATGVGQTLDARPSPVLTLAGSAVPG